MLKSTAVRDSINKDVLLEFHQWLQEGDSRSSGHHGILDSIETAYIPYKKLVLYFDQHRVKRMLEALFPEGYDAHLPREILANYTRVFSILLESGKGRFITYFVRHADLSDENLPFDSRPPAFPLSTDQNMLRNFQDCQWVFCAHLFDFDCNVTLNANCILPIIEKERVGRNNTTIRHKILLDGEYNKLLPFNDDLIMEHQRVNTFVLKTYQEKHAESYYRAECQTLRCLKRNAGSSKNIVNFLGNFEYLDTFNLLFEYADRGSLEHFITNRQNLPPASGRDIARFWAAFLEVADGLRLIHTLPRPGEEASSCLFSRHHDLKPSNILLFSSSDKSQYDLQFKISDFGAPRFQTSISGHHAYEAPECEHRSGVEQPNAELDNADIWSLSCIYSEIAIWIYGGSDLVTKYRAQRQVERSERLHFSDIDSFHDGKDVLSIVGKLHQKVLDNLRSRDFVTKPVLCQLVKNMLDEPEGRPTATQLSFQSRRIISEAESRMSHLESSNGCSPLDD